MTELLDKVGDRYKEFEVTRIVPIAELQLVLKELTHLPSGASIMHLQNADIENVFSLLFRTLPSSSNGAPHIVEHTVLCGSEKYPVKDPFFAMTRRSLHTYMNALTGSDFTCYPAASQVPADFYNLLEVYLDAVFKPFLSELSFLQEGHRLELSSPEDLTSPLIHKGIVFNEMKGSLSSPDARLWKKTMSLLFPTLSYKYNAGGDPEEIARLSYQEFLDFYKTYYHPSRCLFYFYGNIPIQQHLDFLLEHTLKSTLKKESLPSPKEETRFKEPIFIKDYYPSADEDPSSSHEKVMLSLSFLTCNIQNQRDSLALQVLDLILMGTDASPLKQALLKSRLCKQADSYIDSDMTEMPFVFICKGCTEENAKKIRPFILENLRSIALKGIPDHLIEAALHQLEFARSEITGTHSPFGLSLFMRSALLKQHGVDPEEGLKIHSLFNKLRESTKNPDFLPSLIRTYLIENPHHVELIMMPDKELIQKEQAKENSELEQIRASLPKQDIEKLAERARDLKAFQEKQEHSNIDVLPKVALSDVSLFPREFLLKNESVKNLQVYHHECFTNKIIYADLHFTAPAIAEEDLVYLRLFCSFLTEVGCGKRSYQQNLEYIQEHIGGISAFFSLHVHASDPHKFAPTFGFKGKALQRKTKELFSLLNDLITSAHFDEKVRIKELLQQHHSNLESTLTNNALKYALNLSTSSFSVPSYITENLNGLKYLLSLRKVVKEFEEKPEILITRLQDLQQRLLGIENAQLILSSDQESYNAIKEHDFYGLPELCKKPEIPFSKNYILKKMSSEGRITSTPVAFTSMSVPTISYTHKDAALLSIAAQLFENKVLHKRIREQGGAYGGGASSNSLNGYLSFYAYRDPHIAQSIKAFREAVVSIAKGDFEARDIEEAQLGLLQDMDGPIAPGHRASTAFSWYLSGKSFEVRKHYRSHLLNATKEEIQRAINEHILTKLDDAIVVCFAGKALLEQENAFFEKEGLSKLPIYTV